MIEKIVSWLAAPLLREFFGALFNFWSNKKALDEARGAGWLEAHNQELKNILADNLTAHKLEEKIRDAQKPPTTDALNDWLLSKRTDAPSGNNHKG